MAFQINVLPLQHQILSNDMVLDKKAQELITKQFGRDLKIPTDFNDLSDDIKDKTGELISVNTLKRLFGWLPGVEPRESTLDILARYAKYGSWKIMEKEWTGKSSEIGKISATIVYPEQLHNGQTVVIKYEPNRTLRLKKINGNDFEILDASSSKLQKGDIMVILSINKGLPFIAKEVWRKGQNIGSYQGGKGSGIQFIEVI